MDELERQIARLPRPEPSAALDTRIEALLNRRAHGARRWRAAWIAAPAIGAGIIGFLSGRLTAPHSAAAAVSRARQEVSVQPQVVVVTANHELTDLFILPAARENLLGGGRPTVETSSSNHSRSLP